MNQVNSGCSKELIDKSDIQYIELSKPQTIKSFLLSNTERSCEQFFETKITELQNQRAALFDDLLRTIWQEYLLDESSDISLNAVGGYGRSTLHPKSDIDICILLSKPPSKQVENKLSQFLTKLWDLGVDIGSSVRTEKENLAAAKSDITIATNLLDIRTITGNETHASDILNRLYTESIHSSHEFFEHKLAEQEQRHLKAKNTALFLEPNIKNNPGGMRDFQTIIWIARKHFNVNDVEGLKSLGFLKPDEYYELIEAYNFICRIRWALHNVANRPIETLLFEYQTDVAKFMKFGHGDNAHLAVEKMMRQLFRAMTRIREINQMMIGIIRRELSCDQKSKYVSIDIDEHFAISKGMIEAKYDEVFFNKANVIRLFRLIAEYEEIKEIAPDTLRLLRQTRRSLLGELQDYQECRKEFLSIINHNNGLKLPFSLMHRFGVLASYCPEWKAIEGQMQFDMHNAYTVDEHAFKLIQFVDSFSGLKKTKTLIGSIYKEATLKHILVIAGLCHDLSGKQTHENNEFSAMYAKDFALLHSLKKSEVDLITWLVEQQNLLTSTVQTRDIHDPETIKSVATLVRTESKLNALYLFTVADLKATNDKSWNEWQESLLNELYFALRNALKNGIESIFEQRVIIRENKSEAKDMLISIGFDEQSVDELWHTIPSSFFISNQINEIVEFTGQILADDMHIDSVALSEDTQLECTNVLVYAKDRSMLFVDLFNTLASMKVIVKEAQLHKTKKGRVVEVIKVLDHDGEAITDNHRSDQIKKRIELVLRNGGNQKPTMHRHVNNFESNPEVEFLPSTKKNKTLLRVSALDNPLFIEKICNIFQKQQLTIHSAKISSLGESCENVFSISTVDNQTLSAQDKEELAKMLLDKIA